MVSSIDFMALLPEFMKAADMAARRIMQDHKKNLPVTAKPNGTPATETDLAAENLIMAHLRGIVDLPIVAEEAHAAGLAPTIHADEPFILVDALDGTRDFIRHGDDFTVNIALIQNRAPVLGVIVAPVFDISWHAALGHGTYRCDSGGRQQVCVRVPDTAGLALLGGKTSSQPAVLEPFLGTHTVASREHRASSLKFCLLAEGQADVYPRLGDTCEWDTAAGDIILREAGGTVLDIITGQPLVYGKHDKGFINNGFIAASKNTFK